jgi:hypothetical protein
MNKPFDLAHRRRSRRRLRVVHAGRRAARVSSIDADVPVPPKFCHQLDYSTSGIITLRKTRAAAAIAQREFAARRTVKRYSAIAVRSIVGDVRVDAPNCRRRRRRHASHAGVSTRRARVRPPSARAARTLIVVLAHGTLARSRGDSCSLRARVGSPPSAPFAFGAHRTSDCRRHHLRRRHALVSHDASLAVLALSVLRLAAAHARDRRSVRRSA